MNPELELPPDLKIKDNYLAFRQKLLSGIFASLGHIAENIIKQEDKVNWKEQFEMMKRGRHHGNRCNARPKQIEGV